MRRLFRIFSTLSLLFWLGLFGYIMAVQPQVPASAGWPDGYNACVSQWGKPGNMEMIQKRCGGYYALLGDRNAPFLARAHAQIIGRLSSKVIGAYLSEVKLQPGQRVEGSDISKHLGTSRMVGMAIDVVKEARAPMPRDIETQQRCMLDKARLSPVNLAEETLQQQCVVYR